MLTSLGLGAGDAHAFTEQEQGRTEMELFFHGTVIGMEKSLKNENRSIDRQSRSGSGILAGITEELQLSCTKNTQMTTFVTITEYNFFNGPLLKIACNCDEKTRTDCWSDDSDYEGSCCDDSLLVGADKAFWNDDKDLVMQKQEGDADAPSVTIRKTCLLGGRCLLDAVSSNYIAFDTFTAGNFALYKYERGCHSIKIVYPTDRQLDTTMVVNVKNSVGIDIMVIGQLVGASSGICMTTFCSDIYTMNNDLFDM